MTRNHKGIDRREFLKLTAAGSGLVMLGCGSSGEKRQESADIGMRYTPCDTVTPGGGCGNVRPGGATS